jgi:peptidoglycan/LPS O-acetylase OafA/YrhL
MPTAPLHKRSKALDILRAAAIFLVLGRHMMVFPNDGRPFFFQASRILERGGWAGVDLFFVLSGFLISGLLFSEYKKSGKITPVNFLIRRGFKIYPAFFVFLAVSVALACLAGGSIRWKGVAVESLFLTSYLRSPALFNHTWSLGVEEHFYILLPFLLLFLVRRAKPPNPFRAVPRICLCLVIVCLALRIISLLLWPDKAHRCVFQSHCRFDGLFFGVMLAYFSHFHTEGFKQFCAGHWKLLMLAGVLCYIPPFIFPLFETPFMVTAGLSILVIGGGCFLAALTGMPMGSNVATNFLAYIGSHSYSIYLWHEFVGGKIFVFVVGNDMILWKWLVYLAGYLAGSVVFGIVMAKLVEFPLLALRDRIYPSRS